MVTSNSSATTSISFQHKSTMMVLYRSPAYLVWKFRFVHLIYKIDCIIQTNTGRFARYNLSGLCMQETTKTTFLGPPHA